MNGKCLGPFKSRTAATKSIPHAENRVKRVHIGNASFDRETGELLDEDPQPICLPNAQVEMPPNGGSESKNGVVGG